METHHHLQRTYERTSDFDSKAQELRLPVLDWKLAFALDGLKSGVEVARELRLSESRANEVLERLHTKGLIAEEEISLTQFRERLAAAPPTIEAEEPLTPAGNQQPAGIPLPLISTSIRRASPPDSLAANGIDARTEAPAPIAPRPARGAINFSLKKRFKLKSAIDFIHGHAGGGTAGELAVYRVFMQVPGELLRDTGLEKLDFSNESIEIDNPKLRQAIVDAISKTLRVPLPVSYFLQ